MVIQDCVNSGHLSTSAGALDINSNNAIIENCSFISTQSELNGGAIINFGTNAVFVNDTFIQCQAGNYGIGGSGGAIYSTKGISVTNCEFLYCGGTGDGVTAGYGGGAIAIVGGSYGQTNKIANSYFEGCFVTSYAQGGAIYLNASAPDLTITQCKFDSNFTSDDNSNNNGGALSIAGFATISKCTFTNNYTDSPSGADGGAVYVSGSINLSSCIFDSNTADNNGGAIAFEGLGASASYVTYSSISNCTASSGLGNAIYHTMLNAGFYVNSCLFFINDNSSNGTNASLYLGAATRYEVNGCTIYNPSDGNTDSYAIWVLPYASSVSTIIENSIIMDLNHADVAVHTGAAGGSTNVVMAYCIGNINNNFSPNPEKISPGIGGGVDWAYSTADSIKWVDPSNLNYMNAFKLDVGSPATIHGHPLSDFIYEQIPYDINQFPRNASSPSIGAFQFEDNETLLPIQLIEFTASPENNSVRLNWQVASQLNNAFFTIQKSKDPSSNPLQLATVAHIPGAGNSAELMNYLAIDSIPYLGISYYRLSQTDYDGKTTYFNWEPVLFSQSNQINSSNPFVIFPNPCNNQVPFTLKYRCKDDLTIFLYDIQGDLLFNQIVPPSIQTNGLVNLSIPPNLPHGIYFLRGLNANSSFVQKVIIEN